MHREDGAEDPAASERWPQLVVKFDLLLSQGRAADAAEYLTEQLGDFTGALRQRVDACVSLARACGAKWRGDARYPLRLRECWQQLRAAACFDILQNNPALLTELCADALELDIEPDFCRSLITRRALVPPGARPARWPWLLRVHVLGGFSLERDSAALDVSADRGRALDIIRVLAVARDHTCPLVQMYEWLWPHLPTDQARPLCDHALRQLPALVGRDDLVVLRDGKLRLAQGKVWVDIDQWEVKLAGALWIAPSSADGEAEIERAIAEFPGPPFGGELTAPWALLAADRVRVAFIEVVLRLGHWYEELGNLQKACTVYQRAIDVYPTSERCWEVLLRARIAMGDQAAALQDYLQYERNLVGSPQANPSAAIRALVADLAGAREELRQRYPDTQALQRRSTAADS